MAVKAKKNVKKKAAVQAKKATPVKNKKPAGSSKATARKIIKKIVRQVKQPAKKAIAPKKTAKFAKPSKTRKPPLKIARQISYKSLVKEENLPVFTGKKKKFYELLMQVRKAIQGQVDFHASEALTGPGGSGDLSNTTSNHMADFGSDNFLHDMELEMMSSENEVIEMIDEAIQRLQAGEYGKCLDCGCQIPDARLEAKPHARFCIKCKSAREENNGLRPEFNR